MIHMKTSTCQLVLAALALCCALPGHAAQAPFADHIEKMLTVPNAIDRNGDGELSSEEVLDAPRQLRLLDLNGDGVLDYEEIGAYLPMLPLVRSHHVTNVIDEDGDVNISAEEMANAAEALSHLDRNGDWRIDKEEIVFPKPAKLPTFNLRRYPPAIWQQFRSYQTRLDGPMLPGADAQVSNGYTLVHDSGDNMQVQKAKSTYLLDDKGQVVHEWPFPGYAPEATTSYLLPNGQLLRTLSMNHWTRDEDFPVGAHSSIQLVDWDGACLRVISLSVPEKYSFHHDVEYMPNGNILAIRYTGFTVEEAAAMGWDPALGKSVVNRIKRDGTGLVWMDSILELKPDLADGSTEIVWQWNSWEHFVQDRFPNKQNFGDVTNPAKIHVNYLNLDTDVPFNTGQFHHINSVDYHAGLDMVMLSSPTYGEVWFIDHSTSMAEAAGSKGGRHKRGGDLLYRWGNDESFGKDTRDNTYLFWQHNTSWIDEGLPGAGHVLIYNNGTRRTLDDKFIKDPPKVGGFGREYTNLLEIKLPIDRHGNFRKNGKAEVVWSWESQNRADFYSPFMSGLQRMPNGNTLFCVAYNKRVLEVTQQGDVVMDYRLPGWGRLHRIQKYAPDYPGLPVGFGKQE